MPEKEEMETIVEWCEQRKKERKSVYVIERNPFSAQIGWTRNIINIEIDRPLALAAKTSLVYDSVAKQLYRYVNSTWMPLNANLTAQQKEKSTKER